MSRYIFFFPCLLLAIFSATCTSEVIFEYLKNAGIILLVVLVGLYLLYKRQYCSSSIKYKHKNNPKLKPNVDLQRQLKSCIETTYDLLISLLQIVQSTCKLHRAPRYMHQEPEIRIQANFNFRATNPTATSLQFHEPKGIFIGIRIRKL